MIEYSVCCENVSIFFFFFFNTLDIYEGLLTYFALQVSVILGVRFSMPFRNVWQTNYLPSRTQLALPVITYYVIL